MLYSGEKFRVLRDKKNKYSNSCVVRKKSERNKKPYPGSRQEPFRRLKNEVINNSEDGTWLRIFNSDERITTLIVGIIQKHLWKVLV